MTRILYCGSSSVCLELEGSSPYYAEKTFTVELEGREPFPCDTNVFSLFDLIPNTAYTVIVRFSSGEEERVSFRTAAETCCISVKDFGAVGDGVHDDTNALQAAVNFLPEGGRLFFPDGVYLTLPLALRSHITLDLHEGATLLASTDRERYPIIAGVCHDPVTDGEVPMSVFEGAEKPAYQSFLQAAYAEDIRIVGRGRIDGNGQNGDWWTNFNEFPAARPRAIFLNRCKNITLHGVTVQNSQSWNIHPLFSQDIAILDCFVTAPKVSPNTDAIDPESCNGVQIIGCRFSVGDDCIAVKAGKIDMARKYKTPAENHVIRNCLMEYGHGGVTMGSELSAGIHNLSVTQCYFRCTDRGLRIKSRRGRGKDSVVTNVEFDNIRMEGVLTPIVINMWYNCCDPDRYSEYVWSREALPVDDRTPHLGSFAFRNMECTGAEIAACYIDGLPESHIDCVEFENIRVSFAENARPGIPAMKNHAEEHCRLGLYMDNVKKIRIKNVRLEGVVGDKLIAEDCDDVVTEGFED